MTLNERINSDLKQALKSGDRTRLGTIRLLRAAMIELSKRGAGKEITPDDELSVLTAAIKKRKEAIELYEKGGGQTSPIRNARNSKSSRRICPSSSAEKKPSSSSGRLFLKPGRARRRILEK